MDQSGDPCFQGTAEMITIRGTKTAHLGGPPDESRVAIEWREDYVLILITGETLQRDDAIAIAEKL
jgi:hypothetical protein